MKPIVIAGNGPSLAKIDYSRLPQDFDVFRCNQFYFEDKYFLGKKIKGVFFNPSVLEEQFYTLYHLKKNREYEVEDVYCFREDDSEIKIGEKNIKNIFPSVKSTYDFLKKLPVFDEIEKFYRFYFRQWPTSGIVMLYTAIAQGYREIYLTGIDFYRGGGIDYAFTIDPKSNLAQKYPSFRNPAFKDIAHSQDLDVHFIQLALSIPGIKIYAISPDSVLCEFLPLAPIQNQVQFVLERKASDYICDLMQSPNSIYTSSFRQKLKNHGLDRNNIYVRMFLDFVNLVKAIFFAIRNK